MRAMAIDENLVQWVDNFMQGRNVVMSVDGQDGEAKEVTTGPPQGSPVSPALFAILSMVKLKGKWRTTAVFRLWVM